MKRLACGGVLTVLSLALLVGVKAICQEPDVRRKDEPPVGVLMRAKLASAQKVMEGLVTEKFELVQAGAKELHKISDAAQWRGVNDPVYNHQSAEFRRLTEKLLRMAEERNLDGASFTYLHMTTNCITCHQYVRDVVRMADEAKPRTGEIPPARPLPRPPGRALRTNSTDAP